MTAPAPAQAVARVLVNQRLTNEIHEIHLRLPLDWGPALPGQFVMLECPPAELFGLRRPFSLSACRRTDLGVDLEIVYGAVGLRTRALARLRPGDRVELSGPFGRPFTRLPGRVPVLVAGGRGIAPILMLAEAWAPEEPHGLLLYGVRHQAQLVPVLQPPYPLHVATDDGSEGFRGTVIALLDELCLTGVVRREECALYACGPNRMLAALAAWAAPRRVPCLVSLETHFGCGLGICAGCAVPVRPRPGEAGDAFHRYAFACVDGPVMDATRVEWEGLAE
mgnify:CR=1 FL=1